MALFSDLSSMCILGKPKAETANLPALPYAYMESLSLAEEAAKVGRLRQFKGTLIETLPNGCIEVDQLIRWDVGRA